MSRRTRAQNLWRIIVPILTRKFEPVEAILGLSAIAHGAWLMTAGWQFLRLIEEPTIAPQSVEVTFGAYLAVLGLTTLASLSRFIPNSVRSWSNLLLFIGWLFAAAVAFVTTTATGIAWVAYLTIALVSALIYLNVSVGAEDGPE